MGSECRDEFDCRDVRVARTCEDSDERRFRMRRGRSFYGLVGLFAACTSAGCNVGVSNSVLNTVNATGRTFVDLWLTAGINLILNVLVPI